MQHKVSGEGQQRAGTSQQVWGPERAVSLNTQLFSLVRCTLHISISFDGWSSALTQQLFAAALVWDNLFPHGCYHDLAREFSRLKITMQMKPTIFRLNIIQTVITARKILHRVSHRDRTRAKFPLKVSSWKALITIFSSYHVNWEGLIPTEFMYSIKRSFLLHITCIWIQANTMTYITETNLKVFLWVWFSFIFHVVHAIIFTYFSGVLSWSWPFQIHHPADAQLVLSTKPTGFHISVWALKNHLSALTKSRNDLAW